MDKRKYTSEEVAERVVEALMNYKNLIKQSGAECIDLVANQMYERLTHDIKSDYDY